MKIGFIGNFSENLVDGVSVSTYILARELVLLGHEIYFLSFSNVNQTRIDKNGIIIKEFKSRFLLPIYIKNYLKTNNDSIDIFCIKSVFIPNNYLVFKYLQAFNRSYVFTPHGGYDKNVFRRSPVKKIIFYYLFDRKIIKNAKGLICISPQEYNELSKLNRNSTYIPDPIIINDHITSKSTESITITMVYLGRLDIIHKGLLTLLKIFYHIQLLNKHIHLKLYGEGTGKTKLKKTIIKYNLKNCDIYSPVYGRQKMNVLSTATLYIQTSKWETFGRSIFEALSVGTPVAISPTCDYSGYLVDNKAGIALDPNPQKAAKQIINFLSNKYILETYQKNGISLINSKFAAKLIAQDTVQFLSTIA